MRKRRPPETAGEFAARLQADPEFVAKQRLRERERTERSARLRAEQEPILADLREIGWNVNSVWDLVNTSRGYGDALPVLLRHLSLSYSDRTREGIARALAVPDAKDAWPILAAEYRKAPMGRENGIRLGAKDGLAVALAATASNDVMDELIALATDRSHGSSRLLLLRALRKSKSKAAERAIEELASDPELAKEIASW
jgi:hypothetical protein